MYLIKNYHTNEVVAIVTDRRDAIALTTAPRRATDPVLIFEEKKV
jgi:hypothetical protein